MACSGCKKSIKRFKKELEVNRVAKVNIQLGSEEKLRQHFMKVCIHGVPNGFKCMSCNKVISIPDDAKVKSDGTIILNGDIGKVE